MEPYYCCVATLKRGYDEWDLCAIEKSAIVDTVFTPILYVDAALAPSALDEVVIPGLDKQNLAAEQDNYVAFTLNCGDCRRKLHCLLKPTARLTFRQIERR